MGKTHPVFQKMLSFRFDVFGERRANEYNKQLYDHCQEINFQHAMFNRSIFGMVDVYNNLPQEIVDHTTVSGFQKCLTLTARRSCQEGDENWSSQFTCRYIVLT